MIYGLHLLLPSRDADADRAFLRDVLGLPAVEAHSGSGWLIFKAPPSELAVHPSDTAAGTAAPYLMCDDLETTVAELTAKGVATGAITGERWGRVTTVTLPGGGELGLYQPDHATALDL